MRNERPGGGAPGDRLHHRRLDFDEIMCIKICSDISYDSGARLEDSLDVVVDDEIDVALPVALFDVGQPMPLAGQWTQSLCEEVEMLDFHR